MAEPPYRADGVRRVPMTGNESLYSKKKTAGENTPESAGDNSGARGCICGIQRFSLDDGPGIRTIFFLQGCNQRCPWCHNPESLSAKPLLLHRASRCTLCGRCLNVCPNAAVTLVDGAYRVDHEKCTKCGACVENCFSSCCAFSGRYVTAQDVLTEAAKDRAYYEESGGGVTFSGGEPTLQPAFLLECLRLLKAAGIATALETNGSAPVSFYQELAPFLDCALIDVKSADDARCRAVTGLGCENSLAALKFFASRDDVETQARTPVIPGFNADRASLSAIAKAVQDSGAKAWRLLPYHTYGVGKYASLGMDYPLGDLYAPGQGAVLRLLEGIDTGGVDVSVAAD